MTLLHTEEDLHWTKHGLCGSEGDSGADQIRKPAAAYPCLRCTERRNHLDQHGPVASIVRHVAADDPIELPVRNVGT